MTAATWLALLSALGITVVAYALAVLAARLASLTVRWMTVSLSWGTGAVVAAVAVFSGLGAIPAAFLAPTIALGGLFGVVVLIPLRETTRLRSLVVVAIAAVLVFAPTVSLVFDLAWDPFATGIGYLDLGAVLPLVGASAVVVMIMLLQRTTHGRVANSRVGWPVVWPAVVAWAGWIAWQVGMELAIDRHTPVILLNAVIMPIAAVVSWSIVERARHRSNGGAGIALAIVAGCAGATAASGYLIPLLGALTALIVGAAAALVHPSARLRLPVSLLVGGGVSLVLLGLVGQDVAFIYTGQPEVLFTQLLTVVLAVVAGAIVGVLDWLIIRASRVA